MSDVQVARRSAARPTGAPGKGMKGDILIVDDEAAVREAIAAILGDEGYERAPGAPTAPRRWPRSNRGRRRSCCSTSGWRARGSTACRCSTRSGAASNELPVIMISGHGTIETAVTAIKKGAYDFLEKPFKADRLLVLIERALEAARLKRENAELKLKPATSAS